MGPEHLFITHLIKFCLANVSDEIFNVFNGFDIGITNLYWLQNILVSVFNGEPHSISSLNQNNHLILIMKLIKLEYTALWAS